MMMTLAIFLLEDALSFWTNLGKHPLFVWLSASGVKTGTRFVIHLDEQSSVVHCSSHTKEDSLSRQVLHLVPSLNTRDK